MELFYKSTQFPAYNLRILPDYEDDYYECY